VAKSDHWRIYWVFAERKDFYRRRDSPLRAEKYRELKNKVLVLKWTDSNEPRWPIEVRSRRDCQGIVYELPLGDDQLVSVGG
jgi:hypothetical protein